MGGSGGSIRLIVLSRGIVSRAAALLPTGEEEEKSETPLTLMSRNGCAVGAEAEVLCVACGGLPATIRTTTRALRGRGSGDAFAVVSWARYDDLHRASERRTGRFLVRDLRPGCPEFQSGVGAGFEPATDRLGICCSTRLSYPEVGVPESNRRPAAMPLLYRTELTPSRNIFPRHRACATAAPRAPDGQVFEDPNPYRRTPFDRCFALPAVANRQSMCAPLFFMPRCHPRRASRRSTCVPHGGIPRLRDPTRTSVSGRSSQDASE